LRTLIILIIIFWKNDEIKSIKANDFKRFYKAKPNKILLINVRENEEFSISAIEELSQFP